MGHVGIWDLENVFPMVYPEYGGLTNEFIGI